MTERKGNVIKLPPLNEKKRMFPLWWNKAEAACNAIGCAEALEASFDTILPLPDTEGLDMSADARRSFQKE